ncbi:hypothetical protein Bca52824_024286 [Brassica carinata]|uniref:F-box domain-containing protein n=1 Tax=Brassica carinata TaxID=52824 RepID=A0A8X8ATJ8_BRACI|nr:hypothetical protein Bca52824_024286 [Brassica carinata]
MSYSDLRHLERRCFQMSSKIRAEKKQSPSSPITSLPEDVAVDILARVPRDDYPRVSLVSKRFRSLVSSPEIYARRSSLGFAEHCLYVLIRNVDNRDDRLYTRIGHHRLVFIPGLPALPRRGSLVAVSSRIYVFGGVSMPFSMSDTVAAFIDGRIYVVGSDGDGSSSESKKSKLGGGVQYRNTNGGA